MKNRTYIALSVIGVFMMATLFPACKKYVEPTLIITVVDSTESPLEGASVHAYPGDKANQANSEEEMDQKKTTKGNGEARFEFPNSAVLDVDVTFEEVVFNDSTFTNDTTFYYGRKVVKIERIRQRDDENIYEETIEVE